MNKFFIGLLLGILIAGGLAFYLNKAPLQFSSKLNGINTNHQTGSNAAPVMLAPGTKLKEYEESQQATSDSSTPSPKYDFYDILQGKKDVDQKQKDASAYKVVYYLQVGVFSDSNLANDMQARLALLGIESKIKSQVENNKVLNRVIIGPVENIDDLQEINTKLKQENINASVIKERVKQEEA